MATTAEGRFMQQQGFPGEAPQALLSHFHALRFQPWIVGPLMLTATVLQLPILFFCLAAVLAWNVIFPQWNPFERLFDGLIGQRRAMPPLAPAPAPRRFAQGMAAAFMLGAGLAISWHWMAAAYVCEGLLVIAFTALLGGRFCLGAYIYQVLRGRAAFANATCPWSRD
jgi:hypothetical protein